MPPAVARRASLLRLAAITSLAAGCLNDTDCSLNGVCASGACACDAGWRGADCGALDVFAAAGEPGGFVEANFSSWGGSVARDPDDAGLWHMFAARIGGRCGLGAWASNSEIVRAESRAGPSGPFAYVETVVPYFAHGPSVRWDAAAGLWYLSLIHI